jgi:ribosomal protein S18 acetylase RimI-like enzyme
MQILQSHPHGADRFAELATFLTQNARTRLPGPSLLHPGDLVWRLQSPEAGDDLHLFYDDEGLAAFAWLSPPTELEFDLRAGLEPNGPVAEAVFDWAEARRRGEPPAYPRFVDLKDMDEWAREIEHPAPAPADVGRCLTALAFESQHALIAALELGSTFDRTRYEQMRQSTWYDEGLDIVCEVDGELASYCIAWADPGSGLGILEPVGTREGFRGRGVARAVVQEAQRRLKERGMRFAQVATAGFNAPARALYESSGFHQVDTLRTFMRTVDG